ncbi:MAG TPA: signal peptidase I [bacterium]|jgi:signal peptidase I|nr:signal peptidase I [bacterium]HNZ51190.1 signal peptidase I [bacterium]HOF79526.1 signal peptidase I [bacterium]HOH85085.1 signal peptidase I [bacterium]HOQ91914.1 signal peptidase I [bacterium]
MIFTYDFKARLRLWGISLLEIVKVGLLALAIVLPIRLFIVCPFYVKGASMEPNFYDKEYLLIDEISYRFQAPQRGEVVVFRYPQDPREYFIKRIIGLPGETLKMDQGDVYLLDKSTNEWTKITETYLPSTDQTFALDSNELTLGPDEFFVLGDNRAHSRDSRFFGPLNRRYIVGRVMLRGLPISRAQIFKTPSY